MYLKQRDLNTYFINNYFSLVTWAIEGVLICINLIIQFRSHAPSTLMHRMNPSYILYGILFFLFISCSSSRISNRLLNNEAPASFKVKFETSKGDFVAEFHRAWSPKAVDRVYQLIKSGFYDDEVIFRVVKDYVAQFGINNDSTLNSFWGAHQLIDEPVIEPNTEGAISFARGGPNTRGTQLFINIKNNSPRLDTLTYLNVVGFPVVGKIIENKTIADQFYSEYGNSPRQDSIQAFGNKYLNRNFPELDHIKKVRIIK